MSPLTKVHLEHMSDMFCSGLTSLLRKNCRITTVCVCDREIDAHFYSAASLKYHAPDI